MPPRPGTEKIRPREFDKLDPSRHWCQGAEHGEDRRLCTKDLRCQGSFDIAL